MLPRLSNFLKVKRSKCKTGTDVACGKRCSCQKNGLFCVMDRVQCQGEECSNESKSSIIGSSRPEVFCKKSVLRNFTKFTGKHLCQSLFFNKVAGLRHRCFPVNFVKFLRTRFFIVHLWWLLLDYRWYRWIQWS